MLAHNEQEGGCFSCIPNKVSMFRLEMNMVTGFQGWLEPMLRKHDLDSPFDDVDDFFTCVSLGICLPGTRLPFVHR